MGKRSDFKRVKKDFYRTFQPKAIEPLRPHLEGHFTYVEPCAGKLDLVLNIGKTHSGARCVSATDVNPYGNYVIARDATNPYTLEELNGVDMFITNPPWTVEILHKIILNLVATGKPVWLLFYSDWMFTVQAKPYLKYCKKIVAVPRLKWIEGTEHAALDNTCWYLFQYDATHKQPEFYGRE